MAERKGVSAKGHGNSWSVREKEDNAPVVAMAAYPLALLNQSLIP